MSGGYLLLIDHGSLVHWSWALEDTDYTTAEEAQHDFGLSVDVWRPSQAQRIERLATSPAGEQATAIDIVVLLSAPECASYLRC
ncbi:MAG: hypothetical protein AAGG57_13240 [Pseudomonadota bacterium]